MSLKLRVNDQEGSFTILEPEIYEAVFTRYEQTETQFGPGVKMFFNVMPLEGGEPVEVSGLCSLPNGGLTAKSKLRGWIEGIVGRKLAGFTEEIDLDKLIGRQCRLDLDVIEKSRDDGTKATFNRINGIKPYRAQRAAPPPPAPKQEEPLFPADEELPF